MDLTGKETARRGRTGGPQQKNDMNTLAPERHKMRYHNTPAEESPQDPLDAPLTFTRFRNVQAKERIEKTATLRGLVEAIPGRVAKTKDKLPLIKLATFGDVPTVHGSLRHDANMREVYGIEIDYDAGDMTPEEAIGRFREAGVAAVVLTSPSHGQPGKGERWRGLLPLSHPVPPEEREQYVAWANGLLGGVLGTESFTASQTFYAGAVEGWHQVELHLSEGGRYLDTATELAPKAIGKPNHVKTASGSKLDEKAALASIRSGASYHESLMALGGHWANAGVPMAEARARLEAAMRAVPEGERRPEWKDRFSDIGRGLAFIYGSRFKAESEERRDALAGFDDIMTAEEEAEIDAMIVGPKEDAPAPPSRELTFLTPAECALLPARPYVIKGLLAQGDVAAIVGRPGAGKSLLAPRLGYAVAQGGEVFGRRTRQGVVFYVAAEDGHGMRGRLSALRQDHGEADAFHLVGGVSDLLSKGGQLKALRAEVKARRPALIIIDTLAMAFPGLEENSAEGMGQVVAAARSLTTWGAAVVLVHHTTKADDGLPRGHSLLNGALDMSLALTKDGDVVTGRMSKNRNGPSDVTIAFSIGTRRLGTDEDDEPIKAAICEELESHHGAIAGGKLTGQKAVAFDILARLAIGGQWVTKADWRTGCHESAAFSTSDNQNGKNVAFRRAVEELCRAGKVQDQGDLFTIITPVTSVTGTSEDFTDDMQP